MILCKALTLSSPCIFYIMIVKIMELLIATNINNKFKKLDNNFMQQVITDVTATSEQVGRNKKFRVIRANTNMQQPLTKTLLSRLKSTNQTQQQLNQTKKLPIKPRSSVGRRPLSSRKLTQTNHSVATASSSIKSEQQVKQLISSVLTYSRKLQNILAENKIDEKTAYEKLASNEVFTLSLVGMISNRSKDEEETQVNKCVERCCVHKLQRILAMERQRNLCERLESKIGSLIQERIKQLSHFS